MTTNAPIPSTTDALKKDLQSRDRSLSPVPGAVRASSCSSEASESEDERSNINKAGIVSPHTICHQRSLSAAVVTKPDVQHEYLEGRPKIVSPPPASVKRLTLTRSQTVPIKHDAYFTLKNHPGPLRMDAWSEAFAPNFKVRSRTYLDDAKKCPSQPALFRLLTVDLVRADRPDFRGLCAHPRERVQTALRHEAATGAPALPEYLFAVNLCVPAAGSGKRDDRGCYHCVFYFGLEDKSALTDTSTPVGRVAKQFFFGDSDRFRDQTFKLIPRIAEGNFVVRKAVGSKPSLLGNKLKQHYIRTDRYMELIVDIDSNSVAQRIVKLALGYAKTLTVDMMFLLEGATEQTLPEQILGGVRMKNVNFKKKDGERVLGCAI